MPYMLETVILITQSGIDLLYQSKGAFKVLFLRYFCGLLCGSTLLAHQCSSRVRADEPEEFCLREQQSFVLARH